MLPENPGRHPKFILSLLDSRGIAVLFLVAPSVKRLVHALWLRWLSLNRLSKAWSDRPDGFVESQDPRADLF